MKELLYVVATVGRGGKEIYLACDENRTRVNYKADKIYFKWTENIDEAMATFTYGEIEEMAKNYFKNYTRWYIRSYYGVFK